MKQPLLSPQDIEMFTDWAVVYVIGAFAIFGIGVTLAVTVLIFRTIVGV